MTIELKHPERLWSDQDLRYSTLVAELAEKSANRVQPTGIIDEQAGQMDWDIVRLLSHLSFSPILGKFLATATKRARYQSRLTNTSAATIMNFPFSGGTHAQTLGSLCP